MNKTKIDYGKYFTKEEFTCTHCGKENMDQHLLYALNTLREEVGFPLEISSGYRCKDHPLSIDSPTSSHIKGLAVDIKCTSSKERHAIIDYMASNGFNRAGISKSFIHLDIDSDKAQDVIWVY